MYYYPIDSTYIYMFRPCILAIVRLYYKLSKWLYNNAWVLWVDEISSYCGVWHVYELR